MACSIVTHETFQEFKRQYTVLIFAAGNLALFANFALYARYYKFLNTRTLRYYKFFVVVEIFVAVKRNLVEE